MPGYYEDPDKITFDDAEIIVERYIREYSDRRSRVTCRNVARAYEVESSHHNLVRINSALDDRLETSRESGSKAQQYILDDGCK